MNGFRWAGWAAMAIALFYAVVAFVYAIEGDYETYHARLLIMLGYGCMGLLWFILDVVTDK